MRVTEHLPFRHPWTRALAFLGAAVLAVGVVAGCGSSGSANSLTLYSGQHVQTTAALVQAFEKATGITVNTRSDDEDVLAAQISTEGSNSPADVFYTENSPALEYLQGKGLLSPVLPSTLAKVPAKYSSPQGQWVGVSARVSVIIYNPSLISASQLPTSVMQLADAQFKGKLAFAPSETDFQPIVTSVAKTYGDAAAVTWLKHVASNAGSRVYPDNETVVNEVNRGSAALGIINQYYWYRIQDELGGVEHARQDRAPGGARRRLCDQRLGCGRAQVEQPPSQRAALFGVPGLPGGPADHRPLRELRVPDPPGCRRLPEGGTADRAPAERDLDRGSR